MFYLNGEQKAPRLQQGSFVGNRTLVFCAVAETEALMQCVGRMVGAGGAHWPFCVLLLDGLVEAVDLLWTRLRPQSLTCGLHGDVSMHM